MHKQKDEKIFYDIADGQAVAINLVPNLYYDITMPSSVKPKRLICRLKETEILVTSDTVSGNDASVNVKAAEDGRPIFREKEE